MDLFHLKKFRDMSRFQELIEVFDSLGQRWLFATDGVRAIGFVTQETFDRIDNQGKDKFLKSYLDTNSYTRHQLDSQHFMAWLHSNCKCDDCKGSGEVSCEACDGTKKIACEDCCADTACDCCDCSSCEDGKIICGACEGSGTSECRGCSNTGQKPGRIFNRTFNLKLIKELSRDFFEEALIPKSGSELDPILFRGPGLAALIMPMRGIENFRTYQLPS